MSVKLYKVIFKSEKLSKRELSRCTTFCITCSKKSAAKIALDYNASDVDDDLEGIITPIVTLVRVSKNKLNNLIHKITTRGGNTPWGEDIFLAGEHYILDDSVKNELEVVFE